MNKKITLYELLGLVKDGKAPKKIKYDSEEYKITKILMEDNEYYYNYIYNDIECLFPINTNCLNDEVEILDDEDMEDKTKPLTKKDIEALGYACGEIKKCFEMGWNKSLNNEQLDEDKNSFTGWKMYQNGKEVASMDCSYDEDMEIEELHIINGAVDGKWENGSSYNYTLSAPQTVIIKKVNELVREINKLKKDK